MYLIGCLHSLTSEKRLFVGDVCVSQQCTPLWSPELYAVGVPSVWAECVLLLWQAAYCGQSCWHGSPSVWVTGRPYLVRRLLATGRWLGYEKFGYRALGNPRARAGSPGGGVRF